MDLITNPYSPPFNYTDPDDDLVIDREELISIDREELDFPFNMRNKPMLSSFQLSNISDKHVAFRVKTTNLRKYSIQPKKGILLPQSQTNVTVAMQAFKVEPSILECHDKFLVQSVAAPAGATVENITPEMFDKDAGFHVQEFKLTVDFDVPTDLEGVYSEEEEEEETSENATVASTGFSDHQITPTKFNKEAGIHVEECKLGAAEEETSENDTSVYILIAKLMSPPFNYTDPDDDLVIDREELISIDREVLDFPFNMRNKPMLSSFQLSNISDKHVAFRVKTTNLRKYSIQPKKGILLPQSQTNVTVAMQAFKVEPSILVCHDKFLVQSVAAPAGATVENITPEMFDKDAGFHVQEFKLTVDFDVPTDLEGVYSEEEEEEETSENATAASTGFSDHQITPTKFNKEAGIHVEECKLGAAEEETSENDTSVFAGYSDRQIDEVKDLILAFTNEKLSIIQANVRLQDKLLKDIMSMLSKEKQPIIQEITSSLKEEVDFFKRGPRRISGGGGVSIYYVLLLVVLGILLVHIVSSLVSLDFS